MISAILPMMMFFTACASATGPDDPVDKTPHPKSVTVKYVQVLPLPNPEAADDIATLVWVYDPYQGDFSNMPKTAENTYQIGGVRIETETVIHIYVADPQEWNGSSNWVGKYIYIDGQELVVSSTYGEVKFKYGNDGIVKVVS